MLEKIGFVYVFDFKNFKGIYFSWVVYLFSRGDSEWFDILLV